MQASIQQLINLNITDSKENMAHLRASLEKCFAKNYDIWSDFELSREEFVVLADLYHTIDDMLEGREAA